MTQLPESLYQTLLLALGPRKSIVSRYQAIQKLIRWHLQRQCTQPKLKERGISWCSRGGKLKLFFKIHRKPPSLNYNWFAERSQALDSLKLNTTDVAGGQDTSGLLVPLIFKIKIITSQWFVQRKQAAFYYSRSFYDPKLEIIRDIRYCTVVIVDL